MHPLFFSPVMKARKSPHQFPDTFNKTTLGTWAAAIQRLPYEAEQCFLDQVVHYKALSDMEHVPRRLHHSSLRLSNRAKCRPCHPATSSESQQAPPLAGSGSSATATASSFLSSLARYLGAPITRSSFGSQLSSPDENGGSSPRLAYDGVQVSHDGTLAPILAHNGPSVSPSRSQDLNHHIHVLPPTPPGPQPGPPLRLPKT